MQTKEKKIFALGKKFNLHACCFEVEDLHSTFGFVNLFDKVKILILARDVWNNRLLCLPTSGTIQQPHK